MSLDRRTLIAAAGAASVTGAAAAASPAPARRRQLQDSTRPFLWGTAGASYQIEGNNYASELWLIEHVTPTLFRFPSGDADDTYNRIEEDLDLAQGFGFNAHRLSLEWSRIEPEPGQVSRAGLDYYRRVLEGCRRRGLAPVVTYNHWTVPRWFAEQGAFSTRDGVAPFVRFCETVTRHMGDLMETAATFNEANIRADLAWNPLSKRAQPLVDATLRAAAAASNAPRFSSPILTDFRVQQPVLLEAHAKAYAAIKAIRPDLPTGITLSLNDDQPAGPDSGPDSGFARKQAETFLPWMDVPADWFGVQTYTRARVGSDSDLPPEAGVELTQAGYEFRPEALEAVIRKVAAHGKRPIYVTENGIATADDTRRIAFIKAAVAGVQRAMADGIDVRGYLHWSLLDNWEWLYGYTQQFGLVAVDRQTFKRTPKPSASYLGRIARTGKV